MDLTYRNTRVISGFDRDFENYSESITSGRLRQRINQPLRTRTGEYVGVDSITYGRLLLTQTLRYRQRSYLWSIECFRANFPRPSAKIETSQAFVHFCIRIQANKPEDRGVEARLAMFEERLSRIERTTVPNDDIRSIGFIDSDVRSIE